MQKRNWILLSAIAPVMVVNAISSAGTFTWDGGGADGKTSTTLNWLTDVAPAATGDNLIFAGTTNLNVTNDSITSLATSGTALTFNTGAGSFNLSGNQLTVGNTTAAQVIIQQNSANAQIISANIKLSGGDKDRSIVFATGAGSLTLSGNIDFNNDWLFPTTTAGTIVLSGNNTGDGKATAAISGGTNAMRAMMRNNVAGTVLTLGSDTAMGNSGSGDISAGNASLRGLIANQNLVINTVGNRDLSNSSLAINAANITYNGSNNLKISHIINHLGNRDFVVSGAGTVTAVGGLVLSGDQTGRRLFDNLSGTGGMVVAGKIYDTMHSGGITTTVTTSDSGATATKSVLRKAGSGMLTLNGDSSSTFNGVLQIEVGTVKLGHGGALGASDGTAATATQLMGGTLDVNGQTINEFLRVLSNSTLTNSSATAASITANTDVNANLVIDLTGDLTATRLIGLGSPRTFTKLGNGTLTTSGNNHNNLSNWDIQAGKVILANTSGLGADRGVTLNGGTLQLSGLNSNLVNDNQTFTINTGTFDLNGKGEAILAVSGTGGVITNTNVNAATLYVGGGVSGTGSGTYGGVIQNGAGVVHLTKEGSGTQTLSGTNTYSGKTTIASGTLSLASVGSIDNSSMIDIATGATLNVSAHTEPGGYHYSNTVKGNGTIEGSATLSGTLAPGNSPGTLTFASGSLTLGSTATTEMDIDSTSSADQVSLSSNLSTLTYDGTLKVTFNNTPEVGTYDLFNFAGASAGNFDSLSIVGSGTLLDALNSGVWTNTFGGLLYTFSTSTGDLVLSAEAVPEPLTAAGVLLLASRMLGRRSRLSI